jgi:hypothetical protein
MNEYYYGAIGASKVASFLKTNFSVEGWRSRGDELTNPVAFAKASATKEGGECPVDIR